MDPMTGAVVIAGLSATDHRPVQLLTGFVDRITNQVGDPTAAELAVPLQSWIRLRTERGVQIIVGAAQRLDVAKVKPQAVPGRILVPILETGSLEEDNELRDTWSRLLATAANPTTAGSVLTAFPYILSELSPIEMQMLRFVYTQGVEQTGYHAFQLADVSTYFQVNRAITVVHRDNLERLKLVGQPLAIVVEGHESGEPYTGPLYLTPFGYAFIQACSE